MRNKYIPNRHHKYYPKIIEYRVGKHMDMKLLAVGVLVIIIGVIRHFMPQGVLPRVGVRVQLPGYAIVGLGFLLVIAGLILG
jgi:hypothetical protein